MIEPISPRFSRSFPFTEFDCHDGTTVPPMYIANGTDLCVGVLQPVRDRWGPLIVISGYRTPEYNTKVGGKPKSAHLTCSGADVRPVRLGDLPDLIALVESMYRGGQLPALGGFGKYKGWIHLDIMHAADGHLRRWFGEKIGSEPDV